MAATATVEVRVLDAREAREVVAVAKAAAEFMKWAAPVSMDGPQWDAWINLRDAVEKLEKRK